jgi:hypothetical protein
MFLLDIKSINTIPIRIERDSFPVSGFTIMVSDSQPIIAYQAPMDDKFLHLFLNGGACFILSGALEPLELNPRHMNYIFRRLTSLKSFQTTYAINTQLNFLSSTSAMVTFLQGEGISYIICC